MDPVDRIYEICQLGEDCALSKIADIIGMTDVEKERDRLARELAAIKETMDWDVYTCPDGSIDVYLQYLDASGKRQSVGLANIEDDGSVDSSLFGRTKKTKMRGVFGGFDEETGDPFPSSLEREESLSRELAAWKRAVREESNAGVLYGLVERRVAELMKESDDG